MGDSQEVKVKNPYLAWSPIENKTLLRLLVDGVNSNWRDASGSFNKLTVEQRILPELNRICGSARTYQHYKNRIKILRGRYKSFVDLLRYSSGFGWDPKTKKFTARQEVWEDYFKGHPKDKNLSDDSFEDYEDLSIIFGDNTASGKNAVGLGDNTDARIFGTSDSEWELQDLYNPLIVDDDEDDDIVEKLPEQDVSPSLVRKSKEKLPIKRKAKTVGSNIKIIVEEIKAATEMSTQMFSLIQQKWEKELEEKQNEEKSNDVWAAVKEIPDLDEDVRIDAMNLVHQMGLKAGFVSMTVQERLRWIKRSVLKQ